MESRPMIVGWREWVGMPEFKIPRIKAKIDTGARTSALHAFELDTYHEHGAPKVRFALHPKQYSTSKVVVCVADLVDIRWVTDSGGHREQRPVIETELVLGDIRWMAEITLACREDMRFRMLLGRTALHDKCLVNPAASYLMGKRKRKQK